MHWNYRIIEKDGHFGIYEVYYEDDDKSIISCTMLPVTVHGDDVPDLEGAYKMMAEAFKGPILKYEDIADLEIKNEDLMGSVLVKDFLTKTDSQEENSNDMEH